MNQDSDGNDYDNITLVKVVRVMMTVPVLVTTVTTTAVVCVDDSNGDYDNV